MDVLRAYGALIVLYLALKIFIYFFNLYWLYFTKSKYQYADFGKWAVVTGCTSGLGQEFAYQLAAKGLNIVLVSRNEVKLAEVAKEIKQKFANVDCKIIVIDFSKSNEEQFNQLTECIRPLQVGILINNAGVGTEEHFFMDNLKHGGNNMAVASCNILSPVQVIEAVLPKMVDEGKGLVVNISSVSGLINFGIKALYGSSKKFLHNFSLALGHEYANKNIVFQSVCPAYVVTNMTTYMSRKTSFFMPDVKTFIKYCLRAIGKKKVINGYWAHEIQLSIFRCMPEKYLCRKAQKVHARSPRPK